MRRINRGLPQTLLCIDPRASVGARASPFVCLGVPAHPLLYVVPVPTADGNDDVIYRDACRLFIVTDDGSLIATVFRSLDVEGGPYAHSACRALCNDDGTPTSVNWLRPGDTAAIRAGTVLQSTIQIRAASLKAYEAWRTAREARILARRAAETSVGVGVEMEEEGGGDTLSASHR